MEIKFKWITVKELCELISNAPSGTEIGFTFDDYEDYKSNPHFDPSGWYGIGNIRVFDGTNIVIGYYGDGIIEIVDIDDFFGSVIDSIISGLCKYAYDYENVDWDENTMICVDESDLEKLTNVEK